ncbi:MAG TPA: late competence development ComFB family protein, partial [Spirochaetota bacterium]|nr:late competence development ComFB family protein [Spirochaetota bacterium]
MDLHNLMEDVILQYLDEVLSLKKEEICKCEQCRLDMACYALNKIKPMYVVSSRGVIHTENKRRLNYQNEIDTYSIVTEAVDVVSKTRRHENSSS